MIKTIFKEEEYLGSTTLKLILIVEFKFMCIKRVYDYFLEIITTKWYT